MRVVEFRRLLDECHFLRVHFELERGHVLGFTVQLECRYGDEDWLPVVRYDTAHGFAHCDRLHPCDPSTKTSIHTRDFREALTLALHDLADNWSSYRRVPTIFIPVPVTA